MPDGGVHDVAAPRPVTARRLLHHGRVWDLVTEDADLGAAGTVTREYVDHPGAVAVIALDDRGRVLLQRQYRHPVREELWEPPAGLLDEPGEDARAAAARELYEEADLRASTWHVLADYFTTPGGSNEALRVYLARDLAEVPEAERFAREAEEAELEPRWVPLEDAVELVLGGRVHNPSAVVGILAAAAARAADWAPLRPADAPWPQRRIGPQFPA